MSWASEIARYAASWAAETTKSLTLRPCISAARRTTAKTSGAIRVSRRDVRGTSVDMGKPPPFNVRQNNVHSQTKHRCPGPGGPPRRRRGRDGARRHRQLQRCGHPRALVRMALCLVRHGPFGPGPDQRERLARRCQRSDAGGFGAAGAAIAKCSPDTALRECGLAATLVLALPAARLSSRGHSRDARHRGPHKLARRQP